MARKSIKCLLVLALAAGALPAAVIRGVVLDDQTSRPLARAQVVLTPVAPSPGAGASLRADRFGAFSFAVPAGKYVLKASRRGFLSMEYGQKRWNSSGAPFEATENDTPYLTIRLPRFSGITGTVVDENDIGIPGGEVAGYRLAEPPELVVRARADDRGIYRLPGLEPGNYLVRSAPFEDEGVSYVPTFSRETDKAAESRPVEVTLDRDAAYVDVKPAQGRLFTLSGQVSPPTQPPPPIKVTLVSDMGRQTTQGSTFRFNALAPGDYEIFAETTEGPLFAAYRSLPGLTRDSSITVDLLRVQETQVLVTPVPPTSSQPVRLAVRQRDLAGRGQVQLQQLASGRIVLAPGRWELRLIPPAGYYVSAFQGNSRQEPGTRPDGWNDFTAGYASAVRFSLSTASTEVRGIVRSNGVPVAGAPVILEAFDFVRRRRQLELTSTRTDADGHYQFAALPPGDYRILATFEYQAPSVNEMEAAGASSVHVSQGEGGQRDLELYIIR